MSADASDKYQTSNFKLQTAKESDYYFERHTPIDEGYDLVARYAEEGRLPLAASLPSGTISLIAPPHRHGGTYLMRDAFGRAIIARFQGETLTSGLRIDSTGYYYGAMNSRGLPHGFGSYQTAHAYYEGEWAEGQRQGLGLSIGPDHLHVGIWRADQFRGERMGYHANRIYGIDISRYQHERGRRRYTINWSRLRIRHLGRRISEERVLDEAVDYPVTFIYIKSTEGTTILNRYFDADYASARSHGIATGAYHFLSTTSPPDEQALHFLENTTFNHGDLPPMLDVEPSDRKIEAMGGAEALFDTMRTWLRMVEQATGARPLIYINQRFANLYLTQAPDLKADYHFWIARYGEYKPNLHLDIWQLSGDGHVEGITPECDLNVFNGFQAQWDEFLRTQTIP